MSKFSLCLILSASLAWSEVVLSGVVRNDADEAVLNQVRIKLASGKVLGSTAKDGRFEIVLPSEKTTFSFEKPGFESRTYSALDFKDPIVAEVYLHSTLQSLDTITQHSKAYQKPKFRTGYGDLAQLEQHVGMRLDLNEQIAQIPGMMGQQDFSSKLSYLGSRPGEISMQYQGMELPWIQHLDIGFPGNLSGLSPKVIGRFKVDRGQVNPSSMASLNLNAIQLPKQRVEADLSAGNALADFLVATPITSQTSVAMDYRFLNSKVLKNLGQKYFTEDRKTESCSGADCASYGNSYDLSASDAFGLIQSLDSLGNRWSVTYMGVFDQFEILQDTSHNYRATNMSKIPIFSGNQTLHTLNYEAQDADAGPWGLQWSQYVRSNIQKDTAAHFIASPTKADSLSLYAEFKYEQKFRIYKQSEPVAGAFWRSEASWVQQTLKDSLALKPYSVSTGALDASLIYEKSSKENQQELLYALGILGRSDRVVPGVSARLRYQSQLENRFWAAEAAVNSKAWNTYDGKAETYEAQWEQNVLGMMEGRFAGTSWNLNLTPYGRFILNPEMPNGDWLLWKNTVQADQAWVGGLTADVEWKPSVYLRLKSTASHGSGQFVGEQSLPWSENRLLDLQNRIRFFPMDDTTFSMILIHRASLAKPLYAFELNSEEGTKKIVDTKQSTDLFRTDFRVELDLLSRYLPLKRGRLFLEVDNLFADFTTSALKYLGSQNQRQRGWFAESSTKNQTQLKPYLTRGQGLFLMFGVEASLGF